MTQFDLLDLFEERLPVKILITQENGEKLSLNGSAILKEKPYLEAVFPREAWPELRDLDSRSRLLICLETDESVLFLHASIIMAPGEGRMLLQAEDYVQERQKRTATRVPADRIEVLYWHVDEHGSATSETQRAQALDISSTGMLMRLNEVVEPCRMMGLEFTLPESKETIRCTAQIVRMSLKPDSSIEVAARFEDLDKQQRQRITDFCYGENVSSGEI
jgi:hypothetical protein